MKTCRSRSFFPPFLYSLKSVDHFSNAKVVALNTALNTGRVLSLVSVDLASWFPLYQFLSNFVFFLFPLFSLTEKVATNQDEMIAVTKRHDETIFLIFASKRVSRRKTMALQLYDYRQENDEKILKKDNICLQPCIIIAIAIRMEWDSRFNSSILNTRPIFRYVKTEAEPIVIFFCIIKQSSFLIPRGFRSILCTTLDLSRDRGASENARFLEQTLNVKYFHECIICLPSVVCRKSPIIHTIANIADTSYLDSRPYDS